MKNSEKYMITIILDKYTIKMIEDKNIDNQRNIAFFLDGEKIGILSFLPYYVPSYGIDKNGIIRIWSGVRLFSIELGTGKIDLHEEEEEILAVYPIEEKLLIVCEASIILRQCSNNGLLASYNHAEVIIDAYLMKKCLIISDLDNMRFLIELNGDDIKASPIVKEK